MGISIPYESEGFPAGTIPDGRNTLDTTWGEILLAAITVGRPDPYHVFRANAPVVFVVEDRVTGLQLLYGDYEALFRWSLVRMALEQRGTRSPFLHQTESMKSLDRTEKGW